MTSQLYFISHHHKLLFLTINCYFRSNRDKKENVDSVTCSILLIQLGMLECYSSEIQSLKKLFSQKSASFR